jgi:phage shock protein PspC (stress-responsive transcriptional regulator)
MATHDRDSSRRAPSFTLSKKGVAFPSHPSKLDPMTTSDQSSSDTWVKLRDIRLPREERMVGGVCAAFGKATPIPAWIWRVAFCVSALAWGGGILAYVILMVCIPDEGSQQA